MGLTTGEMIAVVTSLSANNFYKSMTTHGNHHIWQDVYHGMTAFRRQVYIKVTLRDNAPVIQFKEK